MESGHKRSALTAGGNVAAAEVADDVKAREFGDERRVVELKRPALFGAVTNRLPVNADGCHILATDVGDVKQFVYAMHVELAELHGGNAHAINFVVAGLAQRKEFFLERFGKFNVVMADQTRSHSGKIDGDGVYAVKTGSRH